MKGIELRRIYPEFEYIGNPETSFNRIEIDSRNVHPADLFVAIKGTKFDSHTKINDAIVSGATVIVSEKVVSVPKNVLLIVVPDSRDAYARISAAFFGFPSKKIKVVGISGTSGKTTTAFLLYSFFNQIGEKAAFLGTIGEDTGNSLKFKERFPPTTPDAFYLNKSLSEMIKNNVKYAFIEVSSSAILFKRISGISFYKKILTNIDIDHLDVHGSFENYLNCKLHFFSGSVPSILNADSKFADIFYTVSENFKTYGMKNNADYMARVKNTSEAGTNLDILYGNAAYSLFLKAAGEFNVYNFLALTAFSLEEGLDMNSVKAFASQIPKVPGRMHILHVNNGLIIIDFAHNPYEISAVLKYANKIKTGRLITVAGAVGWSTGEKRRKIGEISSSMSDTFILTTDDPRGDDADKIISDVLEECGSNTVVIKDRFEAIKYAVSIMQPGDVLAILGRGEEREIHFKDKTIVKSDEEYVREILNENNT